MFKWLKSCGVRFIKDDVSWKTSLLNLLLCVCMAFFYIDSGKRVEPLIYASFFFVYVLTVFLVGNKAIPILYLIYSAGAIQDITFINASVFLILVMVIWVYPKWKIPVFIVYGLECVIVCLRHDKTVIHLLYHAAYCVTLFFGAEIVKNTLKKRAVTNISENFKKLDLKPEEEDVIRQKAEGKMMKEITGVSKNTRRAYIDAAMKRNGCKSQEELIAMYAIQNRLQI